MKKINSIKQLNAEKKKMVQHQEALEKKIRDNWNNLKVNMKPASLAKDAVTGMISKGTTDKAIAKGLVLAGAAILAKRMVHRKWNRLFRKK